ncbi:hypothetical protein PGT21_002363 [Puccinia graminis f. sp. tritici]|uniref:Uncharacterized protein n=1 Tax=Puccinia graminis f. sp. tritici TaxID=56615 RepID=A0A5B0S799_PUCGR|nr:hypothetical protein PGT21_002363 [Puccinia graminis f. sp. tritici]KAA1133697.1 hypothetical protein PGTUg99_031682 [Puccinia graminis f. sp. tritici]
MSPNVHVDRVSEGADFHSVGSRGVDHPSSSITCSEGKPDKPCRAIRASTPSKYLRRTGLVPLNRAHLKIDVGYKTSIISSSSSSTTSPSSTAITSSIGCKFSTTHRDTPTLPSLTESNLARLMKQLKLSAHAYSSDCSFDSTPHTAMEISYFSDGSSTHSGSDS